MKLQTSAVILSSALLVACGGGGSSTPANNESKTSNPNLAAISGIYDTSRGADESYIYIDNQGEMETYNYEGDSVDNGLNCYSLVGDHSKLNGIFTGATIIYDSSTGIYTASNSGMELSFEFNATAGLHNFATSGIQSNTGLDLNFNGINIKVGGSDSNLPVSSPTISDAANMLCD